MTTVLERPGGAAPDGPLPNNLVSPPARGLGVGRALVAVLALLFALAIGINLDTLGWRGAMLVALGVSGLVVLLLLAYNDFERFIFCLLVVRPVLDLSKGDTGASLTSSSGLLATGFGAILIVTGAIWYAGLTRAGMRRPLSLVSIALMAMMVGSVFSVADSRLPVTSALQVARTLGAIAIFLILEQLLRTREIAVRALVVCGVSAMAPLIVGGLQLGTGGGRSGAGLQRLTGAFLHPNSFGIFLVIIMVMVMAVLPHLHGRTRLALLALLGLSGLELVFTYSRGSWVTLVVGILVIGALQNRRLLLLFPTGVVAVVFLVPTVRDRLTNLSQGTTISGRAGNSLTWRLEHFQEILSGAHGHVLFGIGPKLTDLLTAGGRPPHNDFLRMFTENGVVGLACYVLMFVGMAIIAVRLLRNAAPGLERGIGVGYCGVLVAFLVNSMGANLITQFVILIYVFTLTAVALALGNLARARKITARTVTRSL